MDSQMCGLNTSSESIIIVSYLLFLVFWYTFIMRKVNLTKCDNFLTLYLYSCRLHRLLNESPHFFQSPVDNPCKQFSPDLGPELQCLLEVKEDLS